MEITAELLWCSDEYGDYLASDGNPAFVRGQKFGTVNPCNGNQWQGRCIGMPETVIISCNREDCKASVEALVREWLKQPPVYCRLELPYPPSVNHYWRSYNGRHCISQEGIAYRKRVSWMVLEQLRKYPKYDSRLAVNILAFPPDKRIRDIDNLLKSPLDALGKAGVYRDDSQIDDLRIRRREVVKDGKIEVEIGGAE